MSLIGAALAVSLAVSGQYGYGYGTGYTVGYGGYGYCSQSFVPYTGKGQVVEAVKLVTKDYGYNQDIIAALAGTRLKGQYEEEQRKKDQEARDKREQAILDALERLANRGPAPPQEIQRFDAPQSYVPQQAPPAYGPSPQQPQAAPQTPLYGPGKAAPSKSFNPAPQAPQVPQANPGNFGAGGGDWGASPAQDGQQIFTSLLGNRCASCHSSDAPSGGVAFFDANGEPLALSASQVRKADRAVQSGRMPKNGALPPGEAQAWDEAVISLYQSTFQQARR